MYYKFFSLLGCVCVYGLTKTAVSRKSIMVATYLNIEFDNYVYHYHSCYVGDTNNPLPTSVVNNAVNQILVELFRLSKCMKFNKDVYAE